MRKVRFIVAALMGVVALSAIASATASAAAPEFKPASGKFTSTSGAGTLAITGGNTITCKKDKNSGEITGAKTVSVTITFEECTIFGIVGAKSLGETGNNIVVKATGELCIINEAAKEKELKVGLFLSPEASHIEAGGQLAKVTGTVIGQVTPTGKASKTGKLLLEAKEGTQKFTSCGTKTGSLKGSENEGTEKAATEATTDEITYEKETEVTS